MSWDDERFLKNLIPVLEQLTSVEFKDDEAKEYRRLSNGDRASLRRMNPLKNDVRPPAFWKIVCEYDDGRNEPLPREKETAIAAVLQGMALTADNCLNGRPAQGAQSSFGAALGNLRKNEETAARRFDQLLRARGDRFFDLLRYILRFADSQNLGFSWRSLAELCLTDREERRRELSSQLMKDFYSAQWKNQKDSTDSNKGE